MQYKTIQGWHKEIKGHNNLVNLWKSLHLNHWKPVVLPITSLPQTTSPREKPSSIHKSSSSISLIIKSYPHKNVQNQHHNPWTISILILPYSPCTKGCFDINGYPAEALHICTPGFANLLCMWCGRFWFFKMAKTDLVWLYYFYFTLWLQKHLKQLVRRCCFHTVFFFTVLGHRFRVPLTYNKNNFLTLITEISLNNPSQFTGTRTFFTAGKWLNAWFQ